VRWFAHSGHLLSIRGSAGCNAASKEGGTTDGEAEWQASIFLSFGEAEENFFRKSTFN